MCGTVVVIPTQPHSTSINLLHFAQVHIYTLSTGTDLRSKYFTLTTCMGKSYLTTTGTNLCPFCYEHKWALLLDMCITTLPEAPQLNMAPECLKITASWFVLARLHFMLKKHGINFGAVCHFKFQAIHGCVVSISCCLAALLLVL